MQSPPLCSHQAAGWSPTMKACYLRGEYLAAGTAPEGRFCRVDRSLDVVGNSENDKAPRPYPRKTLGWPTATLGTSLHWSRHEGPPMLRTYLAVSRRPSGLANITSSPMPPPFDPRTPTGRMGREYCDQPLEPFR